MKESKVVIGDLDVFYISYDEPAKEEHWANLMMKFPFAKRVDGVKGFDNAHKECAIQSETDRFISIDGDNIVDETTFQKKETSQVSSRSLVGTGISDRSYNSFTTLV